MASLLLLLVCAALGVIVARRVAGAAGFAQPLNWWIINIALPALVLELIPKLQFEWSLWFLPVTQWLVFLGSWGCFAILGRAFNWSGRRIGALTLTAGLGNTMFIGYPVLEALLGRDSLPYAVVADQLGGILMLTIGGAAVTAIYGAQSVDAAPLRRLVWHRLVRFPAMYAMAVGICVGMLGGWSVDVDAVLLRLGATLTPLALFSAGLQFRLNLGSSQRGPLALALGWKLLLAPLLVYLLGTMAGISGIVLTVGVLQAAMPTMLSASILSIQYDLEPDLANTVLAVSILLSAITLPVTATLL